MCGGGTRSNSLELFIDVMERHQRLATNRVEANTTSFKAWKSDKMPAGEAGRRYLKGGGVMLDKIQYPCCPNQNCRHTFIDGPPGNATASEINRDNMSSYGAICEAFRLFKRGLGLQPTVPGTGELVTKMPPEPKPIKRYLRCHCRQNRADPRTGQKCVVDCFYNGQRFPVGKCPLCLCVCDAYVPLNNYRTIVTVSTLPNQQGNRESVRDAARAYLERGMNINMMQQQASVETYNQMLRSGAMEAGGSIVRNVANEGALAQALDLVGNRPRDALAVHALRRIVDRVEHPLGPNHTSIGSMTVHGRNNIASDDRTRNNQLTYFVP